jgi:hypothetical protein
VNVQTAYRPGTDLVDIWIYQDTPKGRMYSVVVGEDTWEWRELAPEGAKAPAPSLTLQGDVFQALMAKGADILPPSAAGERHLADAIKVRDRLLDKVVPPR